MYKIQIDNSTAFKKDLKKMNRDLIRKKKIKGVLNDFSCDPLSEIWDVKMISPKSDFKYRLRIGDYRVIYSIDSGNEILLIHRIAHRKDIYK